jgi:hypothetical protein
MNTFKVIKFFKTRKKFPKKFKLREDIPLVRGNLSPLWWKTCTFLLKEWLTLPNFLTLKVLFLV